MRINLKNWAELLGLIKVFIKNGLCTQSSDGAY